RLLDLQAAVLGRELELPERVAVLDAAADRDAHPGERPSRHVVVGRREDAALERLAVEFGEDVSGRRLELDLCLGGDAHRVTLDGPARASQLFQDRYRIDTRTL